MGGWDIDKFPPAVRDQISRKLGRKASWVTPAKGHGGIDHDVPPDGSLFGMKFRSNAERKRWFVLRTAEESGYICNLRYEAIRFSLGMSDKNKLVAYKPDFTYRILRGDNVYMIAEEVKGFRRRDVPVRHAFFKRVFPEWTLYVVDASHVGEFSVEKLLDTGKVEG